MVISSKVKAEKANFNTVDGFLGKFGWRLMRVDKGNLGIGKELLGLGKAGLTKI